MKQKLNVDILGVSFQQKSLSPSFSLCRWLPESARWLLAHGRVKEAQRYLDKCATVNKRPQTSKTKLEVWQVGSRDSRNFV